MTASTKKGFTLRGIGPQLATRLAKLHILSDQDILFHLPIRYQDRTRLTPLSQLVAGKEAVVQGEIVEIVSPPRGRTKLLCTLQENMRLLQLRFFHILPFQKELLKTGRMLRCFGQIRLGSQGFEMIHPEFQVIHADEAPCLEKTLTPIYAATEGVSQYRLRKLSIQALAWMEHAPQFAELLSQTFLQQHRYPSLKQALHFIHFPPPDTLVSDLFDGNTLAQKRLALEELLAHRLSLLRAKSSFQQQTAIEFPSQSRLAKQLCALLPYQLTNAQQRVVMEISQDLARNYPMLRLVQGDVGSGKTVVAALAMLQAVEVGYQAALMAPTELLAEQHFRVMSQWLEALSVKVAFLSGSVKATARSQVLQRIASGEAQVVIGTHALFQQGVEFPSLALVVTDEQHRFGVQQRALLREKGARENISPHQLIMTATPIPRTLSMSFYADLDCSVIDELPPGRTPITTTVISNEKRHEIIARVRDACLQGRQVYWVCPLIEESEALMCQSAIALTEYLQTNLRELSIGLIHGRMTGNQKEEAMRAFQNQKTQLLVATTVIEVGVDVPNASVMIIENAERLGLSQLHQLRGRVGRGAVASHCILLYQSPVSLLARQRLQVMRDSTDGFFIAQRDLELRGPGEILGTRQTGDLSFRVADLMRDAAMFPSVSHLADELIRESSSAIEPIILRWLGQRLTFAAV